MKNCCRCQACKDDSDFYPKDSTCKECRKALVRANRAANADYYRAYDRERSNIPHRLVARKAYLKSEAGRRAHLKANTKYLEAFPERAAARHAVNNAVRDGRLEQWPCEVCGAIKSEAHHADYDNPLGVTWLCDQHHKAAHRLARELEHQPEQVAA